MTKISKLPAYPIKKPVLSDFFVGTDSENNLKTVNFDFESVIALINSSNGINAIQYKFSTGQEVIIDDTNEYLQEATFFTDTNTTEVGTFDKLIFNKETLAGFDISPLLVFLGAKDDIFLKIENPNDPNNFFTFQVTNFENHTDYFTFEVAQYEGLYIGELVDGLIYSFYWDCKNWISEKLDKGGYIGTAQTLKDDIDNNAANIELKLNISDYNDRYKGKYTSVANLEVAHPTSNSGDTAIVDSGLGSDAVEYLWDDEEGWIPGGSVGPATTDALPEGTSNLYFTATRVWNTVLTGISFLSNATINAADTFLSALGKLQKQISDLYQQVLNLYIPDTLVRYTTPARVGDQFTFPSGGYDALLSKVLHTNTSSLVTTIAVATTDYKRTDLIYFKSDDTIVKLQGTESLTVAIRPDVPVGGIGICFINVFGASISTPTPITPEIGIQDSLGVEKFKITDYIRFKGASFNAGAKQIEIDPLVAGVIFVSSTGNDSTAEPENRNKPYLTLNAAITAYFLYSQINKIEIITSSTFTISRNLNDSVTIKTFNLYSEVAPIVNITYSGVYGRSTQLLNFNMINGTLNLVPTSSASFGNNGSARDFVSIKVKNITNNGGFGGDIMGGLTVDADNATLTGTGGLTGACVNQAYNYIKIKNVTFVNAGACFIGAGSNSTGEWTIDFDSISHNNTFRISSWAGKYNINHGNISSSNAFATWVSYCPDNCNLNIIYKTGATITSNIGFNRFNNTGSLVLSGIANYTVSDYLINGKNTSGGLYLINAFITCKVFATGRISNTINIESSTIKVTSYFTSVNPLAGVDTIVQPIFKFTGMCFILGIGLSDNFNLISTGGGFSTSVKVDVDVTKSVLYTNGKFDRQRINMIESPLNQYYDTIQRQLVLVDEKEEIINKVLDPTKTYVINGVITLLTGEYIIVPAGGLTISGYGYDTSGFIKSVSGQEIIQSAVGGAGNLTLKDCFFNSGIGKVFDMTDVDGSHALEFNDVNFNGGILGSFIGYRQFTGTTCGYYGLVDGFTLDGTWSGFKLTNSNLIGFGASGTFIKKGGSTVFNNRLYLDCNIQVATGSKICDFAPANITNDKSLQVVNCYTKVNGVIDPTLTSTLFPNITETNSKSYFVNNIGIKNTNQTPYGITTSNMLSYTDDTTAAAGGIVQVGDVYIVSSTGLMKVRQV